MIVKELEVGLEIFFFVSANHRNYFVPLSFGFSVLI